jgi:hypothetical protein
MNNQDKEAFIMSVPSFEKLKSVDTKEKYAFVKELLALGKENPKDLYLYLPQIIHMLDTGNNIIIWAGIELLGSLITVDKSHKIKLQLPRLYTYLNKGRMITANHAVTALSKIATVELELQDKIIEKILKTQEYEYDTEECKNILYGQIIKGMETCYPTLHNGKTKKKVVEFIEKQKENTRNATKRKAEGFLKRYTMQENI